MSSPSFTAAPLTMLATLTGSAFIVYFTFQTLRQVLRLSGLLGYKFQPKKAGWAVITGASDGIGREFALQLAKKGYSTLLLARSIDRLEQVKDECQGLGVESLAISFDYSKATPAAWKKLEKTCNELAIGVLINNVGVSHDFPVSFLDEDPERNEMIMTVNCSAALKMSKIVLPQMIKRRNGLVLNIGSALGKVPNGYLSVYSASKAFLRHWSKSVTAELKGTGVKMQHISLLFVQTAMSKIRKASLFTPTPKSFVSSVLSKCGQGSMDEITPYTPHGWLDFLVDYLPMNFLNGQTTKVHLDIRKRALRKKQREEQALEKEMGVGGGNGLKGKKEA